MFFYNINAKRHKSRKHSIMLNLALSQRNAVNPWVMVMNLVDKASAGDEAEMPDDVLRSISIGDVT